MAMLPDKRIVCAGGVGTDFMSVSAADVWEQALPLSRIAATISWSRRNLPDMSVERAGSGGCVMRDGRFAVIGGRNLESYHALASCEALTTVIGDIAGEHWEPMSPMHENRNNFACVAVAGCIIAAGGLNSTSTEVYDEARNLWIRLPVRLPHDISVMWMGSALL